VNFSLSTFIGNEKPSLSMTFHSSSPITVGKELLRIGIPASKIRQLERYTINFLKLQNFPDGYYLASMDLLKKEERIGGISSIEKAIQFRSLALE